MLDAAWPVEVQLAPPGPHILEAIDPRLAVGAVSDGGADLRVAIGPARIIPVIAFAAGDPAAQVVAIIDRIDSGKPVEMLRAVAPVGDRHVVVDADEIDMRRSPQRVEMEEAVAGAVSR